MSKRTGEEKIKPDTGLIKLSPPRKIDLSGEKALLGVDVPDSLDLPGDMPVFLDYQARWFADESQV
ncbi:TPA: hypothetical protein J1545_004966, partial [Escherichia coli]|nr:hypothetical protein [Escherichia coli]